MGRGRAKAKQTKVARSLKYQALDTDFDALQRELTNGESRSYGQPEDDEDDPYADPYAGESRRSTR